MAAPRKYPEELRERAIRMTIDARRDVGSRPNACRRIGEQLGINPDTLRGWVIQAEIDAIAARLNGRPRKTLDYDTPADRLAALLR
jgi:transposase-like protein